MNTDLATLKALMSLGGQPNAGDLRKALTTATGFLGYNLEPTAKLMLPLFAGLRNRVAVDRPSVGAAAATWRMQLGYGSFNFGTNMGTAFGAVGGATTPSAVSVSADYKTQAINGDVQFEAIPQARGFDDPLSIETSIALSSLIRLEEFMVLGGNTAAVSAPVPVGDPSTLSAANTFAAGVWTVSITALTLQGGLTNAAGNSNVGESVVGSVDITVPGGDCDFLDVYWPPVAGAVGYKVYCNSTVSDAAGAVFLVPVSSLRYRKITAGATDLTAFGDVITVPSGQTFVGVNHVQIKTAPLNSYPVEPAVDGSANANVYEGFLSWAQKSTIYGQSVGSHFNKNMDGAPLTTAGSGISEFDYILQNLWTSWNIGSSLIVTSPAGATSITDKLMAMNNSSAMRIDLTNNLGSITGGTFIGSYLNKYAASMLNGQAATIPVWAHPYLPDGTVLFLAEQVPYQYSREARGFALDVQTPYTYFELARSTRSFPFSTFFTETLKCYHPLAQASIQGARFE